MGTVYAASNQQTGEQAAVKLLSPALATDATFRERFSSEIESLKKLRHPNIVQLFGYGEQDGQLYYAMELIDGSNLQEELRRGRRFTWRDVTQIGIEVCAALKHAHDHGIVHRDLKPANLLYTNDENVKLLDFGIAKLFGNTGITTGSVMGTADYMAPEQAEGKAVSPRTDLYSLGSVMYALLAGRPPFVGKSVPEVVHKVRFEPPIPVSRMALDVPVELDHLIDQLLEKNPQKRVPTALATSHRLKAMEHALSLRNQADESSLAAASSDPPAPPRKPATADPNEQETIRLDNDRDDSADVHHVAISSEHLDAGTGSDHFTVVAPHQDDTHADRFPWQILPLALLFIAVVWASYQGIHWASRPASADKLYAKIDAVADSTTAAELSRVESQMSQFLARYADDPRAVNVERLQTRLELYRLQRRFEDKARRRQGPSNSASEDAFLEIVPLVRSQPDLAAQKLQAFLDVFGTASAVETEQQPYLPLAHELLRELRTDLQQQADRFLPRLRQQLDTAQALAQQDPARARRIYRGIIQLYVDKSWAASVVERAQRELSALGGEAATEPRS